MARRTRAEAVSVPSETRDRLHRMGEVAKRFDAWRPAAEVLTRVRAIQTDFPQIDFATRVGGWPIERFATVHGPSSHGKTSLCHGLGLSFLRRGHFYAFIDAEFTTPEDWLAKLMGEVSTHPGFVAMRPRTFEECVDGVRQFVEGIAEARERGELDADTSAIIVVDSIKKLTPDNLLKRIEKEGATGKKGSVDGYGGRAAQLKAAMTAQWLDELVPLLYHTRATMVAIARESDDPDADAFDRKFGRGWRIQGGKALVYDASLVVRVTREGWMRVGSRDESTVVGERHKVAIWKSKVAGKEDREAVGWFHTSNGVESPEGFDPAADVLELARKLGVVEEAGAWLKFDGAKWNGETRALMALRDDARLRSEIEKACREKFEGRLVGERVIEPQDAGDET